jgi:signal peptidase II
LSLEQKAKGSRRWWAGLLLTHTLAALGCAADLWTKQWVFGWLGLPSGRAYWLWEPYVGLETSINTGALAGVGQGKVLLLAGVSLVALVAIEVWLIAGRGAEDRWLATAMGIILGGILGNLYDRLGLWGIHGVRDWILFRYGSFVWPNFNLADSLLVCGAGMIVWQAIRRPVTPPHPGNSVQEISA